MPSPSSSTTFSSKAPSSSSYTPGITSISSQDSSSIEAVDSYGAPAADPTYSPGPAPPGSYGDPNADLLPEYYKSEINLGLSEPDDIPRIEPFLADYGSTSTSIVAAKRPSSAPASSSTPDLTYGVPAAPVISLSDYNIPDVSDKGFKGTGLSSYGR